MKPTITLKALTADVSGQMAQAALSTKFAPDLTTLNIPVIELPNSVWAEAQNEHGFYKRIRGLTQAATKVRGYENPRVAMWLSYDNHQRPVLIAKIGYGGFVVYPQLNRPSHYSVSATGVPAGILGKSTLNATGWAYVRMLVKYIEHDVLELIEHHGVLYHRVLGLIATLRDGFNDEVFRSSNTAARRLMSLACAVRDSYSFSASTVISELVAKHTEDNNAQDDWDLVLAYVATPTAHCTGHLDTVESLINMVHDNPVAVAAFTH